MAADDDIAVFHICLRPTTSRPSSATAETARCMLQYSNLMTGGVELCVKSTILMGWATTLRLNFRSKAYVSRQYLWTLR